jgi:hypothetical protein
MGGRTVITIPALKIQMMNWALCAKTVLLNWRQEMSDLAFEIAKEQAERIAELEAERDDWFPIARQLQDENAKLRKIVADGINTCQQHDRGLLPVSLIVWEAEAIKKLAALEVGDE